ncbi:MAG: hypothetical protein LBL04_11665, partial [Bacteroidales bacterium]|nr:hypothetical protein [Bacteroidales bacterium]
MRPGKHISGFDLRKGCTGRRRDRLRLSLLLFFIFACQLSLFNAFSQTYPVTVHTLLMPPYSLRLSDYTQPGMQRLTV